MQRKPKTEGQDVCKHWSLMIHSPHELASSYSDIELCEFQFGTDLDIFVTPEIIVTDPALRSIDPRQRNCYFDGEKKLKFFKVYSRRNCQMECEAEYYLTVKELACTPFFMVRDDDTPICELRHDVYLQAIDYFYNRNEEWELDELSLIGPKEYVSSVLFLNIF